MKKILIGGLVGGIIIFICQFLSWTILDLHRPAFQYTPKQTEVLNYLSSQFTEDGSYYMPNLPAGASPEEHEALMKDAKGKPWALISYHASNNTNMVMNMVRGLLVDIVLVCLFCSIISKLSTISFSRVFIASIFTGLICFFFFPYTNHIWFQTFDLMGYFADALVSWGLLGLWLGWWYTKK